MDEAANKTPVLILATLSGFLTPFMTSSVNVALPSIGKEFAMSAVVLSWVASAFLLAGAMSLVPLGRLADIVGMKRIFTYGMFLYTAAAFFIALSSSTVMIIAFRALQGMGGAMIFGTGTAMLISVYPVGERGKALGVNVAAVYMGLTVGPFIGGVLTQYLGWRSVFMSTVPFGVVIIIFILRYMKGEWAEARGEKFDGAGAAIYSVALVSIMYGFSVLPALRGLGMIVGGLLVTILFIRWEMRVKNPLLDVNLFRNNTVFALSNLAALINYSATFALTLLLSLYLQYIKGLNPKDAGLILAAQPLVQSLFSPLAGRLSDRMEPRISTSLGMALSCLSLFFFIFLGKNTGLTFIILNQMLMGLSIALFSSPNVNAIMSSVERKHLGLAAGTMSTMRMTGQMLSMGIAMLIFALFIGQAEITPAYYPDFLTSIRVMFAVFTVFCCGGIFASLARGRLR